ncbi:hypothetical protein [Lacticaseibacillus absianus]|uniref:hypothetical protein n=1 Tax=Lacticaseibacillus absianus TaxID=2729623 RepID=UPI0015CB38B7|nr:hypothetical protein [Lacticaseibacillus absianus]
MKMQLASPLTRALIKVDGTQRWLAQRVGKSKSSINNYMHGSPVASDDAVEIANVLGDDHFSQELGNMLLGLIKSFTGPRIPGDLTSLLVYDDFEEAEEKRYLEDKNIRMVLSNPEPLDDAEQAALRDYLLEKLDSTVMDLTLLTAGSAKLGITLAQLFRERTPTYIRKHYIRKEDAGWQAK